MVADPAYRGIAHLDFTSECAQHVQTDLKVKPTNRGWKPLPQLFVNGIVYHVRIHNNLWERHLAAINEYFKPDCNTAISHKRWS
jgi:hypothetical protein